MNHFIKIWFIRQSLDHSKRTIRIMVLLSLILITGLSGNILFATKWLGEWILPEATAARVFPEMYSDFADQLPHLVIDEDVMKLLPQTIEERVTWENVREEFGGPNSNSFFIEDKDDWFYENVLKECTETLYFREWSNYYNVHVAKVRPLPLFTLKNMWVNRQKQHEFSSPHNHSGIFSFVIFMRIPTHWKEQHALPFSANSTVPSASNFQFVWSRKDNERCESTNFPLSSEDEGRMLFFPAWLTPPTPYREGARGYTAEKVCHLFSGLPSVPSPRIHRLLRAFFFPLLRRVRCATRCRHPNANTQYFALHHPTTHRPAASPAPGRTFFCDKK